MNNLVEIGMVAAVILIGMLLVVMFIAKLYRRASKEISFVRTGFGGQKVIVNGGAIVLPVFHEIIPVNMNTLRLEVRRANEQALITRDRMRVDVLAEFYVRVQPTQESIANAAQTLGMRTMKPEALKELVEGKFVDALRAVAAEMAMIELHEQRVDFVQKVQQVVSEDLLKNGLELEAVSLTGLDQTSREYFNPDNVFDAEGLTRLTEEIEVRRKRRNDVEQDTMVNIKRKNLEAEQQRLELEKEEEYARLEQQREIEIRRAAQSAEISREQAQKAQEAKQAHIMAKQQIDQANINSERVVEEERINMQRQVREKEIDKEQTIQSAQIAKERNIETARIEKERTLEAADIEKQKTIELAEQDRSIAIAEKSKAQSEAKAEADIARAAAVQAEEKVHTVRETEQAERMKVIELLEASKQAERNAIQVTVAAEAEKQAAEDQAESVRILANADAAKVRVAAEGAADAEMLAAEAAAKRYAVEAEGKRALHESENLLSAQQIEMQVKMALITHLPSIISESVKPMQAIDGIKIMQVSGLGGGSGSGGDGAGSGAGEGNLADQVVNSALRYRAQAPLLESLLSELGLEGGDINGLTKGLMSKGNRGSNGAGNGADNAGDV